MDVEISSKSISSSKVGDVHHSGKLLPLAFSRLMTGITYTHRVENCAAGRPSSSLLRE